jgi:hypothetical protein
VSAYVNVGHLKINGTGLELLIALTVKSAVFLYDAIEFG